MFEVILYIKRRIYFDSYDFPANVKNRHFSMYTGYIYISEDIR